MTRYLVISNEDDRVYYTTQSPGDGFGDINIPGSFTMIPTCTGQASFAMQPNQLRNAAGVVQGVSEIPGTNRKCAVVALMTVTVESVFRMYANSTVPESLSYPHEAVGSDHDSLGLFQQRPSQGWGSVAELMNAAYNGKAFIGGPNGPNGGSPPGLLDIPGWETMDYGVLAQSVQVSAFPDRYNCWRNACEDLYDALTA